jgi:hypothetical protein
MKQNRFFWALILGACVAAPAQNLPVILGGALETGASYTRVTPFAGVWLGDLGYARLGYGEWTSTEEAGGVEMEEKERHFSAQIGGALGGADRPYLALSYNRVWSLTTLGDASWNEWGFGLGNRFILSPYAGLLAEVEYRIVAEHYNRAEKKTISGGRLQMNFGFVVFVY